MLGCSALEQARDLLPHNAAHGPHEKRGLHDADSALQAGNGALPGAYTLLEAGFRALNLKLTKVTWELKRIALVDDAVPFLERARVEQVVDAFCGGHAQIPSA